MRNPRKVNMEFWYSGKLMKFVCEIKGSDSGSGIDRAQEMLDFYSKSGVLACCTHKNGNHQVYVETKH